MRAVVVRKVGGPEVVEVLEVPSPEPGPLQVRIKVVAAALNPADAAVWAGSFGSLEGMEHAGLGLDAAGTIEAVGPGVLLEVGTAVIAFDAAVLRPTKAQAEFLVVDLNSLAPAPKGMDLVELARTRGVRIVAQGRPEDQQFLRDRGATWFVSRDEELNEAVRRFVPQGVDGVLDAAALGEPALAAVRDGGVFVSLGSDVLPQPRRAIAVRHTSAGPEATRSPTCLRLPRWVS